MLQALHSKAQSGKFHRYRKQSLKSKHRLFVEGTVLRTFHFRGCRFRCVGGSPRANFESSAFIPLTLTGHSGTDDGYRSIDGGATNLLEREEWEEGLNLPPLQSHCLVSWKAEASWRKGRQDRERTIEYCIGSGNPILLEPNQVGGWLSFFFSAGWVWFKLILNFL